MDYVNPTSDIFIKYLFASVGNTDVLLSFTNAVLEDSQFSLIKEVKVDTPFNLKKFPVDKESVLDVKAIDEDGTIFNIEVQTSEYYHFKKRTLYYWARLYSSQLKEGEDYGILYPTVCINILDFLLFDERKEFHSTFLVKEKDSPEYCLSSDFAIHFLELSKFENLRKETKLEKWLYFFKNEGKEDEILKILIKGDKDIMKAHNNYVNFSKDKELRDAYEAHLKWKLDHNSKMVCAREEGRKEGREEEKIEFAKRLLKRGQKIEFVAEVTDLDIEKVRHIKGSL